MSEASRAVWRKARKSSGNGQCVEVRDRGEAIDVRDSKNPTGAVLTFTPDEWAAFLDGAREGEFDQT